MSSVAKLVLLDESLTDSKDGGSFALQNYQQDFVFFQKVSSFVDGTFNGKVQHSPNNVDWFDLVTFTSATDSGAELKFPSSVVLGRIRASVTAATTSGAHVLIEAHYRTSK